MTPARAAYRPKESEVVRAAADWLEANGFRTYRNVDGRDYFDLIARRDGEVGLVEAKVASGRAVYRQAIERRPWGDWVAVVLASRRSAESLARRTATGRASSIGIWAIVQGSVEVVRPAERWRPSDGDDPFAPLRSRLQRALDSVDRREIPADVTWSGVPRTVRRASGGRGFRDWRLEESAGRSRAGASGRTPSERPPRESRAAPDPGASSSSN